MKSYQEIQLIGNLGQDPKVSDNPNGPVKISVAITEKRGRDADETTEWFDVNVWGGVETTSRPTWARAQKYLLRERLSLESTKKKSIGR